KPGLSLPEAGNPAICERGARRLHRPSAGSQPARAGHARRAPARHDEVDRLGDLDGDPPGQPAQRDAVPARSQPPAIDTPVPADTRPAPASGPERHPADDDEPPPDVALDQDAD